MTRIRTISLIRGVFAFWIACMLFAEGARATPGARDAPILAIVNLSTNKAIGDRLFDALSKRDDFSLVERDQMARILEEQSLSGAQDAVQLGKLVGADGLIFLNDESDLLHVRFVETDRGVRLFDLVLEAGGGSFDAVKEQVLAQIERVVPKLRMEDSRRIYVGVLPFDTIGSTNAEVGGLDVLHTIIAIRLAAADNVLLVERDQLENVLGEQDLRQIEKEMLRSASYTIRGRVRPADGARVRVEVQVRHGADEPVFVEATGDPKDRDALAGELAGDILRVLGASTTNLAGNLRQEATQYFSNGQKYLAHGNLLQAIHHLHVATLLSPMDRDRISRFIEAVERQMVVDAERPMSAREYLRDIAWFEEAMNASLRLQTDEFPTVRDEQQMYPLLAAVPTGLDEDDALRVKQARAAFRRAMERQCAYPSGRPEGPQMERLATCFPYMYDQPGDAMKYLRGLSALPGFPWASIWESGFPKIRYWNTNEAALLWSRYMDELMATGDPERQFAALAARCFSTTAFDPSSMRSEANVGEARKAARQLFAWLQARPENLSWVLEHAGWYIFAQLWDALPALPDADMELAFHSVMMPVLRKDKSETEGCLYFLELEYGRRGGERITARERDMLAGLLRDVWMDPALMDEATRAELAARHGSEPWFPALAGETVGQPELPYPSVPGATLLLDSTQIDAGSGAVFDNIGGVLDEQALWVGWTVSGAIRIARIGIPDGTTQVYTVRANPSTCGGWGCGPMLLARAGSWLCVVGENTVTFVPVQDHEPYLASDRACMLGPVLGDIRLGPNSSAGEKFISMLAGCGDAIYIGLEQEVSDGRKRVAYGALLRWKPGTNLCDIIAASDALAPGPLNDCMPYEIAAACPAGDDKLCMIVATGNAATNAKPRPGIWTYGPRSGKWELQREVNFGMRTRGPSNPRFITTNVFTFSGANTTWFLDVNDYSVRTVGGRVGDADGVHGWTLTSAKSGEVRTEHLVRLATAPPEKDVIAYSANARDFMIKQMIPQRDVIFVLVACHQPSGMSPDRRGLVYRVPVKP